MGIAAHAPSPPDRISPLTPCTPPSSSLPPAAPPADAATPSPTSRALALLRAIVAAARGYPRDPACTPDHVDSLHHFLRRAEALCGGLAVRRDAPHAPRHASHDQPAVADTARADDDGAVWVRHTRARSAPATPAAPRAADVAQLERDFWTSPVAIAWYGPQPCLQRATPARRRSDREPVLRRDASYVGLRDE